MGKRKLLLLLCMLLSLAVQAQTATGHLKFKGVPKATLTARFLYILQRGTATSAWSA